MGDHQIFLGLGGNIGKKSRIFKKTLSLIEARLGKIDRISPVYVSPPWGFEAREEFWNQVIVVNTRLTPREVLHETQKIEAYFGRKRESGRYLSRRMDIDILFYDQLVLVSEELSIPHPLVERRKFVLIPLASVSPDFRHPVTGKSVTEMISECDDLAEIKPLDPPDLKG